MVLGVSRIGSTDSAQAPYGAVFALARVNRAWFRRLSPIWSPSRGVRTVFCRWEGVGRGLVGHENYSRAQEVFCSAKGDLVPTSTFSSQHLVFSKLPLPYQERLGYWVFGEHQTERVIGVLPWYPQPVWLRLCKIHTFHVDEPAHLIIRLLLNWLLICQTQQNYQQIVRRQCCLLGCALHVIQQ